jgi:hypothetical protein
MVGAAGCNRGSVEGDHFGMAAGAKSDMHMRLLRLAFAYPEIPSGVSAAMLVALGAEADGNIFHAMAYGVSEWCQSRLVKGAGTRQIRDGDS